MKKTSSSLLIGVVVVIVITIAVTWYSGHLFGRWGAFQGIQEARTALKSLPMEINGWIADEELELDQTSITMLRIQDSYIYRAYRNAETQAVVRLTLMVGNTGIISVHTPEVCFAGRDYVREETRTSVPFNVQLADGSGRVVPDALWKVNFVGQSLDTGNRVSFYFGVSPGDAWHAVENPRTVFSRYRYIYRIQAESFVLTGTEETGDVVKQFLEDCLPTIHVHLRPCG